MRHASAAALLVLATLGLSWGALSAAAAPGEDPTPGPSGSSHIAFTVDSPTPTATPTSGNGGGSSSGGGTTGTGPGGSTTTPSCVPTTTTPVLGSALATGAGVLRLGARSTAQGSELSVSGDGFDAGEKVVIALYSSPVKLGVFTVRSNGELAAQVTIPHRTQLGTHTIQATGFQDCKVSAAKIEIVSPHGSGTSIFPWVVWAVAGGGVGLAAIGILCAFAFGWLPSLFAIRVSAGSVP